MSKSKADKYISRRMDTFKKGGMHSGKKSGPEVTDPKQAIAIALDQAREKGLKPNRFDKLHKLLSKKKK